VTVRRRLQVAVIGGASCPPEVGSLAEEVGRALALAGAVLVCGGLGGVMEAAARGARLAGGLTVGLLPGYERDVANPAIDVVIPTGLGHARNVLVVASADAVIALAGEHGTASEIALALTLGKPVVALGAWQANPGVVVADSAEDAVRRALGRAGGPAA
jgi:hypothetical protein